MILYVMTFKNLLGNFYSQPHFVDIDPDKAGEQLGRSLTISDDEKTINKYKNLQLWCIGTFDDVTGIYTQDNPVLILDCDTVIAGRKIKVGNNDGNGNK